MIPKTNNILTTTIKIKTLPSRTYKLKDKTIFSYCDKIEAMKQLIYKIINTNRYEHIIYSWNFGIELSDLFGKPKSYVNPLITRRITEALTQDERILSVDAFSFDTISKNEVNVSFDVHTIFGTIKTEKEVNF